MLKLRKCVIHNKIINKTQSRKNQENSAPCFWDNYLTIHLVKFQQVEFQVGLNSKELELLEYALDITFLKETC